MPKLWAWCRLNTLSAAQINSFVDGPFGSNLKTEHYTTNREVRIIQLNNIGAFEWRNTGTKYTTFEHAESLERCKTFPNDIVIAKMMPAGRAIIVPTIEDLYVISSDCVRLRVAEGIVNKYVMYAINSPVVNSQVQDSVHGIGRSRTSLSKCKELLVPISPAREQASICKSIDTIFSLIATVEIIKEELSVEINSMKSKILDLAIRGKLVPQNPDDEPASVLLERIRAEKEELIKQGKIKRDKKESVIFKGDDNSYYRLSSDNKSYNVDIPFDIPNNWVWCNLSMIGSTNIGLTYNPSEIVSDGTIVLRSSNIINGKIDLTDLVRVNSSIRENQYISENDILICARNGSKALVGKCAIFKDISERTSFGAFMAIYRSTCFEYIYDFLNSDFFRNTFNDDDTKQINQLTQDMIKNTLLPLPPLAEQKRIVEAIENAFAQLDEIINSIA